MTYNFCLSHDVIFLTFNASIALDEPLTIYYAMKNFREAIKLENNKLTIRLLKPHYMLYTVTVEENVPSQSHLVSPLSSW